MAESKTKEFTFVSYNLHGFTQGSSLLKSMCDKDELNFDCICVQEHWLTPTNLYKIKSLSPEYKFYGISAMEKIVSTSVLMGRPWGGAGILLKNNFCKEVIFHKESDRFV